MENSSDKEHPRLSAGFLSVIFYIFTFDTFKRGYRKQWKAENLYKTINSDKSLILGDEIERKWNEEKQKTTTPNLLWIILKMFKSELLIAAILLVIAQIILRLAEPILLGKLLKYFKEDNLVRREEALRYGFCIAAVIGFRIIFYNQYKMYTYKTALRTRVACSTLVYRKVLKLSMPSLQQISSGQIINFISYDLNRIDFGTDLIHFAWVAPIFVLSIIYVLYVETGICGLTGVLWFSFVAILQSYNGNLTASIYGQMNRKSSNRLRIMNEIIAGIQVIKMYAWETSFSKLVNIARSEELNAITNLNYVRNIFLSFSTICNHLALCFTLFVIISMKENITSDKIYGLVIYYGVLNFIVSIMFILAISKSVEIWKALRRINDFLLMDEFQQVSTTDVKDDNIIHMNDVEATWNSLNSVCSKKFQNNKIKSFNVRETRRSLEKEALMGKSKLKNSGRIVLQNIDLNLKQGDLVGIVGPVGSGKSSLLQTLLGEVELTTGTVNVQNSISYASQDAWTFAGTLRENILFGQKYDEDRYKEVVRVCSLQRDFELFPDGDSTLVGDRGCSLSGGQKSRINLARAIYRKRNIYLLDDPLSAVDVQVAKHIYQECIENFLKGKSRILVTHHVHHLKTADLIVILNQGSAIDAGKYNELLSRNSIFTNRVAINERKLEEVTEQLEDTATDIIDELKDRQCDEKSNSVSDEVKDISITSCDEQNHKTYLLIKYFFKDSNWVFFVLIFLLFSLIQVLLSSTDFFLSLWINIEEQKINSTRVESKNFLLSLPIIETTHFLQIYGGLIAFILLWNLLRSILYVNFFKRNSKRLHDNMFSKVIHASMEFFENTSSGQILNRFSREMQVVDEFIPRTIMEALMFINSLIAAIVIVLLLNPYVVIMVAVVSLSFLMISYVYMKTSKNIKEVESSLMSPILSHLNESMQGLITIRSLSAQNISRNKFNQYLDHYTSSWYMLATSFAAFGFYIEFVSFLFISIVTLSLIFLGKNLDLSASEVGLAVTQSMALSAIVQYGVLNCAQINYLLVSIGRILEYNLIEQENESVTLQSPPPNWPETGKIIFKSVSLRYSLSKPLVLKNLNLTIEQREKVGIVGRTGAGKSSLLSALFRLAKTTGIIEIDGFDIANLPLQVVRSKLSIIPQDPVLFNGSLRYNLDPFDEYDDSVLYEALKAVQLNTASGSIRRLTTKVRDRGSNFSVGQKQLICLARAIIRRNKIVILDEATANIDAQTDELIQKTMKIQFSNCTVLTVAHRLSTVMMSDKILVIDAGELVEIGHPYILMNRNGGKFQSMVGQTGDSMAGQLRDLAYRSYTARNIGNKTID